LPLALEARINFLPYLTHPNQHIIQIPTSNTSTYRHPNTSRDTNEYIGSKQVSFEPATVNSKRLGFTNLLSTTPRSQTGYRQREQQVSFEPTPTVNANQLRSGQKPQKSRNYFKKRQNIFLF